MHKSIFTYNITRPYPFRWFTPVVFIGGLIAIVLFSFLNFVSNSTFLSVETTTNPNKTVSEGALFTNWPSYLTSKIQPTCQSVDIPVNTKFFTDQLGLTYTLTGVSQYEAESKSSILPSLTYHYNYIQDCRLNAIEMDLDALDRLAAQLAWAEWGVSLRAYLSCKTAAQTLFNLTAQYDYAPETVSFDKSTLYSFVGRDKNRRASLWWGESLLSMYWATLSRTMQDVRSNASAAQQDTIRKGTIYFTLSNTTKASLSGETPKMSILDPEFFDVEFSFIKDRNRDGDFAVDFHGITQPPTTIPILTSQGPNKEIWAPADTLAKSFLSTALVDLGQTGSPYPNILTNASVLQYYTSAFPAILQHLANARPGPAEQDYDTLKSQTGSLQITQSVIFTDYICQVPQKKSAGDVIIAVLIADLVLLQGLWKILGFGTEKLFLRKRRLGAQINHCEGCWVGEERGDDERDTRDVDAGVIQKTVVVDEKKRRASPCLSPSPSRQGLLGLSVGERGRERPRAPQRKWSISWPAKR